MKAIIQTHEDGVAVTYVAPGIDPEQYAETIEGEKIVVETESLPPFDFRNAWTLHEKTVVIDVSKAHEIQRNRWRKARGPILANLDVQFMRALEQGNKQLQEAIATQKQALRDVTKTELPSSLPEIKAAWPAILT
jgi:hypothetical protein